MSEYHERLMGERPFAELIAEGKKQEAKAKDLAEIRDPLRGGPAPAGTHRRVGEAFGEGAAPRLPDEIYERMARTFMG